MSKGKAAKTPMDYLAASKKQESPGKPVKFIGVGGEKFECPVCSRSLTRGIVWEDKNKFYCSRDCIPKSE